MSKKNIVRINAGAGAGKTLIVVLRVINLLLKGVKPEEILLISFTKTAAKEIYDRIVVYAEAYGITDDLSGMTITTFNALGDKILSEKYEEFYFPRPPHVIDNIDRSRIIKELLDDNDEIPGLDYRNFDMQTKWVNGALPTVASIFKIIKTNGYNEEDVEKIKEEYKKPISDTAVYEIAKLYEKYDDKLRSEALIEFADQESMIFELFERDPYYVDSLGFKHIIVDEFQDSNRREIEILKLLRDTKCFETLQVVGDDSQAIFSFKNTTPQYLLNFSDVMGEEIDNINLLENFRSQAKIIDFANKIVELNENRFVKSLIATRPEGKDVVVEGFLDDEDKIDYVINKIKKMIDNGDYNPEDIAILTRNKSTITKYVDALSKKSIPSQIGSAEVILENCRVKAAISLFNAMEDIGNTYDILNYANAKIFGGIMEKTDEEIQELCEDAIVEIQSLEAYSESEKREEIMNLLKNLDQNDDEVYQDFLEKLEFKPTVEKMIEYVNAFAKYGQKETCRRQREYPGVKVMTAHASKGLEWPVVFNDIDDYEKEELPRYSENEDVEEARRLFFVSSTRAREELYVVAKYVAYGPANDHVYNRFLVEAHHILGKEVNASSIEAQIKEKKRLKKAEKDDKKKAKAS